MVTGLKDPVDRSVLHLAGPHALAGALHRWPVVDGIPFLRADRIALASSALAALDAGDRIGALTLLLRDRDAWARGAEADLADVRALAQAPERFGFRDAMTALAFGPVADYFAHRWSDPTYLSGIALAEAYWRPRPRVFELACGAGHFLRAFQPHAAAVTGADVVFAKLWLARHWVAPSATLLCFDAASAWPIGGAVADIAFCHDAFYFLPRKSEIAARLRGAAPVVLVGHVHNALVDNRSAGDPRTPEAYAGMFPGAHLHDDAALADNLLAESPPVRLSPSALALSPAISWAWGADDAVAPSGWLLDPPDTTSLRRNPLYVEREPGIAERRFPSALYAAEYGTLATYPSEVCVPETAPASAVARDLVRRRVYVDLPARW